MTAPDSFHAHMVELGRSIEDNPAQFRVGGDLDRIGLFANRRLRVGVLWYVQSDAHAVRGHIALGSAHSGPQTILSVRDVEAVYHSGDGGGSWIEADVPTDPTWKELDAPTALRNLQIHERGGEARLEVPDIRSTVGLAEADRVLAVGAVLLRVARGMQFAGLEASEQMPFYE